MAPPAEPVTAELGWAEPDETEPDETEPEADPEDPDPDDPGFVPTVGSFGQTQAAPVPTRGPAMSSVTVMVFRICPDEPTAVKVPITGRTVFWFAGGVWAGAASAAQPWMGVISSVRPPANATSTFVTAEEVWASTTAVGSPSAWPITWELSEMTGPAADVVNPVQPMVVPTMAGVETSAWKLGPPKEVPQARAGMGTTFELVV
jgi:hypothetical protein